MAGLMFDGSGVTDGTDKLAVVLVCGGGKTLGAAKFIHTGGNVCMYLREGKADKKTKDIIYHLYYIYIY